MPLSLSRSTSNWLTPFAIGAISGLVAVIWFALLKFLARQKLEIAWPWLIVVALAAAVAGGLAVASAWLDQDVWTVDANIKAAVIAGVSGATTGSMAGLLAVVWKAPPKE